MFNLLTCSSRVFVGWLVIASFCLLSILVGQGSASSIPVVLRLVSCALGIFGMVKSAELRRRQQR